eukprot:1900233-Karenia_brevis.AAC.1
MQNLPKARDGGAVSHHRLRRAGRSALRAALFKLTTKEEGVRKRLEEEAEAIAAQMDADELTRRAWQRQ